MNKNSIEKKRSQVALALCRDRYKKGLSSKNQYILEAAHAYLTDLKPLRVNALLSSLEQTKLTPEQRERADELQKITRSISIASSPTCSLNMITKNESKNIWQALDSVDSIMDEIVICDTGSTDNTVEKSMLYGVKVVHAPWRNNFSLARNMAIEASSCDWIFWMDADDRLEPSSSESLRELWKTSSQQAAAFCIVNELRNRPSVEFLQVRLFPRRREIRFERRIHEQVMFSVKRNGIPFGRYGDIRIRHTGYFDPEVHMEKARRNITLIREEIAKTSFDPSMRLSLGDCLFTLGRLSDALKEYKEICDNRDSFAVNSDVFTQAHINTGLLYYKMNRFYESKKYLFRGLYLDDKRIEAYFHLGKISLRENNINRAADYFIKAARISPPLRLTATNNLTIRLEALYYLSETLLNVRNYQEALNIMLPACQCYPAVPRFYSQTGRAFLGQGRLKEAAEQFMHSLALSPGENEDSYLGMAEIYRTLGDDKNAGIFIEKGIAECKENEKLRLYRSSLNQQADMHLELQNA